MDRRKCLVLILVVTLVGTLLTAGTVFAGSWPDAVSDKVKELHELGKAKKEMPESLEGVPKISGDKAYELWKSKKAVFLDNRTKIQYDTERIPGAEWFFNDDLIKLGPAMADKLDKNKEYVLYCNGIKCWRSPSVAVMLHSLGFKIHWYREGLPDWKMRGYPTE